MVEQIVNMHKRYMTLVRGYKVDDFDQYFAEYFALHTCVKYVRWQQYPVKGKLKIAEILMAVNPGYTMTHPQISNFTHRMSLLDTTEITKEHKINFLQVWDAIEDLRGLLRAVDVLEHVFTDHCIVEATSKGVQISHINEQGDVTKLLKHRYQTEDNL